MPAFTRLLAVGLCAAATVSAVEAQQVRRLSPAPSPTRNAVAPGPGATGSTGGTVVRPELFPADASPGAVPGSAPPPGTTVLLPDGSTMVVPLATPNNVARRYGPGVAAPDTTVMGAALSCGERASDEVRAFLYADGDQNCQLTRAEAMLLGPSARSFDEMDRNSDGVVTRAEFEASLR